LKTKRNPVTKTAKPLWSGRLAEVPQVEAFAFQASINVDSRLVFDDIAGSKAHAVMLGKQGIIPKDSAGKIVKELNAIANEIKAGKLAIDTEHEDIHSFLEAILNGASRRRRQNGSRRAQ